MTIEGNKIRMLMLYFNASTTLKAKRLLNALVVPQDGHGTPINLLMGHISICTFHKRWINNHATPTQKKMDMMRRSRLSLFIYNLNYKESEPTCLDLNSLKLS
ncbi:hypothetical protein [Hoylesella nanceiensis]